MNVAIAMVGFSAYVAQIMTAYGVDKWAVIVLVVLPTILFTPCNFGAAWFFNNWKFSSVLRFGALIQFIGCWLRTLSFIGDTFWLLVMGQFIFFLANPFVLNSITLIANLWFSDKERAQATAISGLMAPLGSLLGFILAGVFAAGVDSTDPVDCMNRLEGIVITQNVIFSCSILALVVFIKEKPMTPPSKLALTFRQITQPGIREDLATLSRNPNFLLTGAAFTILWGNYITLGNVLTPLFKD